MHPNVPLQNHKLPYLTNERPPGPAPGRARRRRSPLLRAVVGACSLAVAALSLVAPAAAQDNECIAARPAPLLPTDPQLCRSLAKTIRNPSALPLDQYEQKLDQFLSNWCHRDTASGWKRDKSVRDTGPFTATFADKKWIGQYHGTHAPVVIWYSPEMIGWMERNRPAEDTGAPTHASSIPDGAVMIKEMFPAPAALCAGVPPENLLPTSGAAVMVRDKDASHDGWFWGWFGWSGWDPDWPAGPKNRLPNMGFGQYCMNCHASAADNLTFADLKNVEGYPGRPMVFLSQHFSDATPQEPHHRLVAFPTDDARRLGEPLRAYNEAFTKSLAATNLKRLTWDQVADIALPSQTYDNVWVPGGGPTVSSQYLTSDQCIGCHDAGGTGLQFDMTEPNPHGNNLLNFSPYATWRTSPMGLGGRDPIFFAQLSSETQSFHPKLSDLVQTTCLGCHGILGQRQFQIDNAERSTGECGVFGRAMVDAVPYPDGNPTAKHAKYGALARDGISCTACHHMVLGKKDTKKYRSAPQNKCVLVRQELLNPDERDFAKTFTGSFLVGPPDQLYGPFKDPKIKPMQHAIGITPIHNAAIQTSEVCGTCHTVHLPVYRDAELLGRIYEQTTYPEWAFSAYRTGETPDGPLPHGAGGKALSCQGCHMPSRAPDGRSYKSKIAGIQEYSNFPQAENVLPPKDIDLPVRDGFARHTLVGLNVFLVRMFQQFPDVLGVRTQDPMLVDKGQDPLLRTEQAMLDQAANKTAIISINGDPTIANGTLTAAVRIDNLTGHKFPSGVGFRRAFIDFEVMDKIGNVLWGSGRTNGAGVIVDAAGEPIDGELWWNDDCSARIEPDKRLHQPHFQTVTRQDQAQIYQELVSAPPAEGTAICGHDAKPAGPLTTSFLSICAEVKDNRLPPKGYLPLDGRIDIALALGAGKDLAEDAGFTAVGDDPDYGSGGGDTVTYKVDLSEIRGKPATVQATLYYQATPPFYLQDRFCTATGSDTERLYFLAGHLNLTGTESENWKLSVVTTGQIRVRQ